MDLETSVSRSSSELSTDKSVDLFNLVKDGRVSLHQTAADWVTEYQRDREGGLVNMIRFILRSAGVSCDGEESDRLLHGEWTELINWAVDNYQDKDCQLTIKKFSTNFCQLIQSVVNHCQNSVLYDQLLINKLLELLVPISGHQARTFRHAGTLFSLSLITGFSRVFVNITDQINKTNRQLEVEAAKTGDKKAADRVELLQTKLVELGENKEDLKDMMEFTFKSVFIHRFKDISSDIRFMCMSELGVWFRDFPQEYLVDSFLKYAGWALSDKSAEVRLAAVTALKFALVCPDSSERLELFLTKFKVRIVSMILDKDIGVASEILSCLVLLEDGVLTDEDCEEVYQLVYSSYQKVSRAAGRFLLSKLGPVSSGGKKMSKRGKLWRDNSYLQCQLLQFLVESDMPGYESYVVDSLMDGDSDLITDWESMTDLLLEEECEEELVMDDESATALIGLMLASIKQAVLGKSPEGRGIMKRVLSAKEVKLTEVNKENVTTHFISVIPPLIHKYFQNSSNVKYLLDILPFMKLETMTSQSKLLEDLLKLLSEVLEKHSDEDVLRSASRSLEMLCDPQLAEHIKCQTAKHKILNKVVSNMRDSLQDYDDVVTGGEEPDIEVVDGLAANLNRVASLSMSHDMKGYQVTDTMILLLKRAADCCSKNESLYEPQESVRQALLSTFYSLLWDKTTIDVDNPNKEELINLVVRRDDFVKFCIVFMETKGEIILADEALISICDLFVAFASSQNVRLRATDHQVNVVFQYLKHRVFVEEEDDSEELGVKRKLLAAYCKLIVNNVIPVKYLCPVMAYWTEFDNKFGDLLKESLGVVRDSNRILCAKLMLETMADSLVELNVRSTDSSEFVSVKNLAKKFALCLGIDGTKNREAVNSIFKTGIEMALKKEGKILLLELVAEFSGRLLPQDKKVVLANFNKRMKKSGKLSTSANEAVLMLKKSLTSPNKE